MGEPKVSDWPDPRQKLHRVGFEFLTPASSIAPLPQLQIDIDRSGVDGKSGGNPSINAKRFSPCDSPAVQ